MKKNVCSSLGLFLILLGIPAIAFAQVDKKAAELKKLENNVILAKIKFTKYENMLVTADSLIEAGTNMTNDSKIEKKAISAEGKRLDKEYATNKKPLAKLTTSKNKEEATKAKAELKTLDTKYKTDSKELENRLKVATKNESTGNADLTKGKNSKKTAQEGLKTAQAALDAAEAKYEAVKNPVEEETPSEKKKK